MFRTTPQMLVELNPGGGRIRAGRGVRLPSTHCRPRATIRRILEPEWRRTLAMLNVEAHQVPEADHIVVDKSEKVLKVFDRQEHLVAQFSATMGSAHDPLPIGTWKINGADTNPKFHYNPKLFWDAKKGSDPAMLPPGPNRPGGVWWLDLSKRALWHPWHARAAG